MCRWVTGFAPADSQVPQNLMLRRLVLRAILANGGCQSKQPVLIHRPKTEGFKSDAEYHAAATRSAISSSTARSGNV